LDLNSRKGLSDLNGWEIGVCSISGLPYPMNQSTGYLHRIQIPEPFQNGSGMSTDLNRFET